MFMIIGLIFCTSDITQLLDPMWDVCSLVCSRSICIFLCTFHMCCCTYCVSSRCNSVIASVIFTILFDFKCKFILSSSLFSIREASRKTTTTLPVIDHKNRIFESSYVTEKHEVKLTLSVVFTEQISNVLTHGV